MIQLHAPELDLLIHAFFPEPMESGVEHVRGRVAGMKLNATDTPRQPSSEEKAVRRSQSGTSSSASEGTVLMQLSLNYFYSCFPSRNN